MMVTARIGSIEVEVDDDQPGTMTYSPEYLEDVAHRLGRQALEIYNGIPDRVAPDAGDE